MQYSHVLFHPLVPSNFISLCKGSWRRSLQSVQEVVWRTYTLQVWQLIRCAGDHIQDAFTNFIMSKINSWRLARKCNDFKKICETTNSSHEIGRMLPAIGTRQTKVSPYIEWPENSHRTISEIHFLSQHCQCYMGQSSTSRLSTQNATQANVVIFTHINSQVLVSGYEYLLCM